MIYNDVNWMSVNDHGATTGNGYLTHTCLGPYKGRVQRRGYTTVTVDDDGENPPSAQIEVIQLPLAEYITFDQVSYAATAAGGQITITGKTNAPRLDFALTVDADGIGTLPTYFSIQPAGDISPTGNQAVTDLCRRPGRDQGNRLYHRHHHCGQHHHQFKILHPDGHRINWSDGADQHHTSRRFKLHLC